MKAGRRAESKADVVLRAAVAANVRELRRIRHLTQVELARRIGIRTSPLNAIEHGKHIPSGRVLFQLAETLQVSVDALLGRSATREAGPSREDAGAQFPAGRGVVRQSEDRPQYTTEADSGDWPRAVAVRLPDDPPPDDIASARINQVCRAFLALEDLCGAQKRAQIPLYLPFAPTEEGVEDLTLRVRQVLGVSHAVIFDYLELLENAGLRVLFCPMPGAIQSAVFHDPVNCNAFLIVRDDMNVERQLFELLKRLGAIYVHTQAALCPPRPDPSALDPLHASRKFAALFLMPAQAVRASVAQIGIAPGGWTYELVLRLKHRFGVSAQSFVLRLKELRLIDDTLGSEIGQRIEAHYARTGYGEPDSSRRVLSPNGRIGDLLLAALDGPATKAEARKIAAILRTNGINWQAQCRRKGGRRPEPASKV